MHHHEGPPIWLFFFVPVWICFGTYVLSRIGGWTRLAEAYPGGEKPPGGVTFRRCTGRVRWLTNYNRSLNVTLTRAGIYVTPIWITRLFHPPLLLPWTGAKVSERRVLFFRTVVVRFADQEGRKIELDLPESAWPAIRELGGRRDF